MSVVVLHLIAIYCLITITQSSPKLGDLLLDILDYESKIYKKIEEERNGIIKDTSIKDIPLKFIAARKLKRTSRDLSNTSTTKLQATTTSATKLLLILKKKSLRTNQTEDDPSSPYIFNSKECKYVDDRLLCGYDRNKGEVAKQIEDLGNGCRYVNDRLECGYLTGPFNETRRPEARQGKTLQLNKTTHITLNASQTKSSNSTEKKNSSSTKTFHIASTNSTENKTVKTNHLTSTVNTKGKKASQINLKEIKNTNTSVPVNIQTTRHVYIRRSLDNHTMPTETIINKSSNTLSLNQINKIKRTNQSDIPQSNETESTTLTKKPKRYCVDRFDWIFCYDVKNNLS